MDVGAELGNGGHAGPLHLLLHQLSSAVGRYTRLPWSMTLRIQGVWTPGPHLRPTHYAS